VDQSPFEGKVASRRPSRALPNAMRPSGIVKMCCQKGYAGRNALTMSTSACRRASAWRAVSADGDAPVSARARTIRNSRVVSKSWISNQLCRLLYPQMSQSGSLIRGYRLKPSR